MKKSKFLLILLFIGIGLSTFAQKKVPVNYYSGNWDYMVKDLPDGDVSGLLNFSPENTGLKGYFVNTKTKDTTQIDKIALADTTMTIYFSAQGQDINLTLYPKSDSRMEGSIMGMFAFIAEKKKD